MDDDTSLRRYCVKHVAVVPGSAFGPGGKGCTLLLRNGLRADRGSFTPNGEFHEPARLILPKSIIFLAILEARYDFSGWSRKITMKDVPSPGRWNILAAFLWTNADGCVLNLESALSKYAGWILHHENTYLVSFSDAEIETVINGPGMCITSTTIWIKHRGGWLQCRLLFLMIGKPY